MHRFDRAASALEIDVIRPAWVQGDRRHSQAVVVYAPRQFTNQPSLFLRGASVAVVDMRTGTTRKLGIHGTLAYFDPGCGAGEDAVVSETRFRAESSKPTATRMYRIHADTGRVEPAVEESGHVSSAVPIEGGVVATRGNAIVRIAADGSVQTLANGADGP